MHLIFFCIAVLSIKVLGRGLRRTTACSGQLQYEKLEERILCFRLGCFSIVILDLRRPGTKLFHALMVHGDSKIVNNDCENKKQRVFDVMYCWCKLVTSLTVVSYNSSPFHYIFLNANPDNQCLIDLFWNGPPDGCSSCMLQTEVALFEPNQTRCRRVGIMEGPVIVIQLVWA